MAYGMQKSRGFKQDARLEATIDLDLPCLDGRMVYTGCLQITSGSCLTGPISVGLLAALPLEGVRLGRWSLPPQIHPP